MMPDPRQPNPWIQLGNGMQMLPTQEDRDAWRKARAEWNMDQDFKRLVNWMTAQTDAGEVPAETVRELTRRGYEAGMVDHIMADTMDARYGASTPVQEVWDAIRYREAVQDG